MFLQCTCIKHALDKWGSKRDSCDISLLHVKVSDTQRYLQNEIKLQREMLKTMITINFRSAKNNIYYTFNAITETVENS